MTESGLFIFGYFAPRPQQKIKGQANLNLDSQESTDAISQDAYVLRAIATNRDEFSDSEIIHWYNQCTDDSENRIKELKVDFGGDTLPCADFKANALYFLISSLTYNLFALLKALPCFTGSLLIG